MWKALSQLLKKQKNQSPSDEDYIQIPELEVKVLGMLHSINIDLVNLIAQAEKSKEFIGQIEGIWHSIANQFYSLAQGFENEDINKLSADLDHLAATWETVANKAKEFVTNSYHG